MRKLLKELGVALLLVLLAYVIPAAVLCFCGPDFMKEEMRETIHELIIFIFNIFK